MTQDENPPPSNFRKLVLVCIEADFCDQILAGKLFTRSTQSEYFNESQISFLIGKIENVEFSHSFSIDTDASRSRQALSNAYLVAKIGFDTEENGPFKV